MTVNTTVKEQGKQLGLDILEPLLHFACRVW